MSLWTRLRNLFKPAADQASPAVEERNVRAGLPSSGRSSVEQLQTLKTHSTLFDKFFDSVDPFTPIEWLDWIVRVSAINPDMSEAVSNFVTLGNPGHKLLVEGDDDRSIELAVDELNSLAQSIYKRSVGADGLINAYIAQIARTGAVSSEDILTPTLDAVKKVTIVPTSQIRFVMVDGEYAPHQKISDFSVTQNLIPLNERTYAYFAWATIENSPYAIPPFLGSVEAVLTQHDMMQSIKFAIKKVGVMGMIEVMLTAPPKENGESPAEYMSRLDTYIKKQAEAYAENLRKSLVVHYSDQEVKSTSVTADSRGVADIWKVNEELMFSGMGVPPALHGRTYSTTETFAGMAFQLYQRKAGNFQMIAKRRMEQTYALHLLLRGIRASASLQFEKNLSLNALQDAQAEQTRVQTVMTKKDAGIIGPDQAAQELGYDEAFSSSQPAPATGQTLKRRLFRYDRSSHSYRYYPETLQVPKKKLTLISR